MSRVEGVNDINVAGYEYCATVMAECIKEFIEKRRITADIPPGILMDAQDLWAKVAKDPYLKQPDTKTIDAWILIVEIVTRLKVEDLPDPKLKHITSQTTTAKFIEEYNEFLQSLGTPRKVSSSELKKLNFFQKFFEGLKEESARANSAQRHQHGCF